MMTEEEQILLCAFRYCLGRMSYIVGQCDGWVRKRWPNLGEDCRMIIERDLREMLARDVKHPGAIGMTIDRDIWRGLLTFIEEQRR